MYEALQLIRTKLINAISHLADFADQYKELPCLAYTHYQAAQPTTVGKRATLWLNDLVMDLSDLDFGGMYPVIHPVVVDGRVMNRAGVLHCELQAETTLRSVCARCATEFDDPQTVDYACVLVEEKQDEDNEDIVVLDKDEVDLADLARTAFILDMDTTALCSEDCQGLCPGCGVNLNEEPCRCKKQVDPRLAALAKLLQDD
jgi:uncharacterized protein